MSIKRERSSNWEREEKQLFREIIKPYIQIIENKNLSTNSNKAKLKAWTEITDKFNLLNAKTRDKKQIINQWKITKLKSKKELTKHNNETFKPCGGPQPPTPSPDTLVLDKLLKQECEIDYNEYDCDGLKDTENVCHKKKKYTNSKEEEINLISNIVDIDKDIKAYNSLCQPPPITPNGTTKKTSKMKFSFAEASFTDMHHFRMLENKRLEKEHELRMKHMEEMHAHVLINLKLQQEILNRTLASIKK